MFLVKGIRCLLVSIFIVCSLPSNVHTAGCLSRAKQNNCVRYSLMIGGKTLAFAVVGGILYAVYDPKGVAVVVAQWADPGITWAHNILKDLSVKVLCGETLYDTHLCSLYHYFGLKGVYAGILAAFALLWKVVPNISWLWHLGDEEKPAKPKRNLTDADVAAIAEAVAVRAGAADDE